MFGKVRIRAAFLALAAVICLGGSGDAAARRATPAVTGHRALNVICFNIAVAPSPSHPWGGRRTACIRMVNVERPDILCLQEARNAQLGYLDRNLDNYRHVGVGRNNGRRKGEHTAIYYNTQRLTLLGHGNFWLSDTPARPSRGWDASKKRIVTWASFRDRFTGENLYVFNTHLDHRGEVSRYEASKLLMERVERIATPDAAVIVCGDMNCELTAPELDPVAGALDCARTSAVVSDEEPSFNAWGREHRQMTIDHIFLRGLRAVRFHTCTSAYGHDNFMSDHYPVKVTLLYD